MTSSGRTTPRCSSRSTPTNHLDTADYESGPSPGAAARGDRFVMPGRPEYNALQRNRDGVEIDDAVVDRLRAVGEEYGATLEF